MIYVLTKEKLLNYDDSQFKYIDSEEFILSYFQEHLPTSIGLDTETEGLNFLDHKVIMTQFGTLKDQFIVDNRYYSLEFMRPIFESKSIEKVLHHAKFDYKMLREHTKITLEKVFCTYIADKVINCGNKIKSSLEECASRYLGKAISKDERKDFIGGYSGPFLSRHIIYGATDVTLPLELQEKQLKLVEQENLQKVLQLENEATLAFADMEYNGMAIDDQKWLALAKESKEKLDGLKEELDQVILKIPRYKKFQSSGAQLDMFSPEDYSFIDVNWGSPKQVLDILRVDNPELKAVSKTALHSIENKSKMMLNYLAYKKQAKLYNSYGPSFLDHKWSDGRIRTYFGQILQTGRVSSSEPNMQQIPADNRWRNCFETGHPDWVFVSSDFSSQELCVIAMISNDPVWLEALKQGKDLHSVCAALVFGSTWREAAEDDCNFYKKDLNGLELMKKCSCPEHKKLRDGVKAINFGLAYGMSEFALADRMQISVQQAKELIETYFTTFPKIRAALERFGEFGKKYGYIMTMPPFKRKRYFPMHPFIYKDGSISGAIERASKNTPIQGSSADMTKLALIYCRNFIKKHKVPVKLVMQVHDQIDTIVHKDYADTWKNKLTEIMEKAALKIITNGLLKAETEISPVWKK